MPRSTSATSRPRATCAQPFHRLLDEVALTVAPISDSPKPPPCRDIVAGIVAAGIIEAALDDCNFPAKEYTSLGSAGGIYHFRDRILAGDHAVARIKRTSTLEDYEEYVSLGVEQPAYLALLTSALEFAISSDVCSQDSPFVICAVANNTKGREAAWQFYKSKAKAFKDRYEGGQLHNRIVKHTTLNFNKSEMADEIKAFFEANFNPAERTVQQSIENILLNEKWLQRDGDKIKDFLRTKVAS